MKNLFFLPFAGGSRYAYIGFRDRLVGVYNVLALDIPGHGSRMKEPLLDDLDKMTLDLVEQVRPHLHIEFNIFGHSMGGLLALLLAQRLTELGLSVPGSLFISGCCPPGHLNDEPIHHLPKAAFLEKLRLLGGMPPGIMEDSEILDFFEPILRNDLKAVETYDSRRFSVINIPLTVLLGTDDMTTAPYGNGWSTYTSSLFRLVFFPGDHFFIYRNIEQICSILSSQQNSLR